MVPEPPAELSAEDYRRWVVRQMKEREWQAWVEREAGERGWITYHTHDSRRSDPGFPDLVCVHPQLGVLWLECKTERGTVREGQRRWLGLLQAAGERAYLVRPRDVDAVERALQGEAVWIGPRFPLQC